MKCLIKEIISEALLAALLPTDIRTPPLSLCSAKRWLLSVTCLLLLGVARLLSLRATNYHQNPSEYGKHSNFFFVLAATKVRLSHSYECQYCCQDM